MAFLVAPLHLEHKQFPYIGSSAYRLQCLFWSVSFLWLLYGYHISRITTKNFINIVYFCCNFFFSSFCSTWCGCAWRHRQALFPSEEASNSNGSWSIPPIHFSLQGMNFRVMCEPRSYTPSRCTDCLMSMIAAQLRTRIAHIATCFLAFSLITGVRASCNNDAWVLCTCAQL